MVKTNVEWMKLDTSASRVYEEYYVAKPRGTAAITKKTQYHMYEVFVTSPMERDALAVSIEDAKRKANRLIRKRMIDAL